MPRRSKRKVLFYTFKGLRCQGRKELRFLKECVRYKWPLPIKAERIETPFGYYTPDFEYEECYIEIKSKGTLEVLFALKSYKGFGDPSDLQLRKIIWVNENIKPVKIRVYLSRNEYKPDLKAFFIQGLKISIIGGKVRKNKSPV